MVDLIEPGRPARDYANNRKKIAVTLYEGDLKYNANGIDRKTGKSVGQHSLTAPIPLHRILEIHEDSTPRNIILQPADDESVKAVAKLLYDPEMTWKPDDSYTTKNRLPQKDCHKKIVSLEHIHHVLRLLNGLEKLLMKLKSLRKTKLSHHTITLNTLVMKMVTKYSKNLMELPIF